MLKFYRRYGVLMYDIGGLEVCNEVLVDKWGCESWLVIES